MVKGHVFIAASLGGFMARSDGVLEWLMKQPTNREDNGYAAFMASVDGLVIGRGSYKTVLSFETWPYEKPVVVLARTMGDADVPNHLKGRVYITEEKLLCVVEDLATDGWAHASVDGGLAAQSFLRDGLISDITLAYVPIFWAADVRCSGHLRTTST